MKDDMPIEVFFRMISRRSFIKFLGATACCALPFIRHIGGKPSDIKPVSAPKYKWIREDTNLLSSGFAPIGTRLKKVRI